MSLVREHHRRAMHLAEKALAARAAGYCEQADKLFRDALDLERHAAEAVASDLAAEPTRSVLYRSAATLALDCGELREAERLIAVALAGNPPDEIAEELRDLLDQVNFRRHLDLRGVELEPTELQLSIAGNAVGLGIASSSCFVDRLQSLERLVYRTAERKRDQPFRERGPAKAAFRHDFELYLSVPRAASFAVTVKLGRPRDQLTIPETRDTNQIIEEMLRCLDLFERSDETELKRQIADEAYYRNFVGLARKIAPDGDDVQLVGLTVVQNGTEKKAVALSRPSYSFPPIDAAPADHIPRERVTVMGELRFTDARGRRSTGKLRIIDNQGNEHELDVPAGMMVDIVRPLWQDIVIVSGRRGDRNTIVLEDIQRADSSQALGQLP
jgi:hypothetical protein